MERSNASALAWGALIVSVAAQDLFCLHGETLSEGVDSGLESRFQPIVQLGIGIIALHLVNLLPNAINPLHQLTRLKAEGGDRVWPSPIPLEDDEQHTFAEWLELIGFRTTSVPNSTFTGSFGQSLATTTPVFSRPPRSHSARPT